MPTENDATQKGAHEFRTKKKRRKKIARNSLNVVANLHLLGKRCTADCIGKQLDVYLYAK